jgi:hypothetical protein
MSRIARRLAWLTVFLAFGVAIASSLPAGQPEPGKSPAGKARAKRAPGGIIVSRETTFITGPLRKDGSVDYLAALNERYSRGVTPENNAAVLFLLAVGPKDIEKEIRERFFEMLGIAPLPERAAYLEPFMEYFDRKTAGAQAGKDTQETRAQINSFGEFERITGRPWSRKDSPIAAGWLEENQKPIDLVVEATKRPRFYVPVVAPPDVPEPMFAATRLGQEARKAGEALCARAMFRIGTGRSEEAWQDLLACHRLARFLGQRLTIYDNLLAIHIEGIAVHGDAILAHEGNLTADQARRFAVEFHGLPPTAKMADKMNWGERFFFLDSLHFLAKKGPLELWRRVYLYRQIERSVRAIILPVLSDLSGHPPAELDSYWHSLREWRRNLLIAWDDAKHMPNECILHWLIDWNEPMRMGNQWIDQVVAALSKPTRKERDAAIAECERDVKKAASDADDIRVLLRDVLSTRSLRTAFGRQRGRTIVAMSGSSHLAGCTLRHNPNAANQSMVPALFALAAYRADHGAYPAELTVLVPKYLPAIPEDLFSGGPLRYKREGPGYVLYSVGPNGKDDGGLESGSRVVSLESGGVEVIDNDDIAIRVPAKQK